MKRLVSLLLAGVMACSLLPAPALAAETEDTNGSQTQTASEGESSGTLINETTQWKYLDNNTDPAGEYVRTSWAAADFDDSAWKTAQGSFGAKKGVITSLGGGCTPSTLLTQYKENGDDIEAFFFRTTVTVADASKVTALTGSLTRDDSATLYINGVRAAGWGDDGITENMQYASASDAHKDAPGVETISITDADVLALLKDGQNTIAVEIHQDRASSSDVYFDLTKLAVTVDGQQQTLINEDTAWKYYDGEADPAGAYERTSWTAADFDDNAWKTAAGPFGAKKGAAALESGYTATTVLDGCTASNDTPAYFFRTTFNIESLENVNQLTGTVQYDDGLIVYINGQRVAAYEDVACDESGTSLGTAISANLQYGGSNGGTPRTSTFTLTDLSMLKEGENVVAVELHQGRQTSSDIWFYMSDLSLTTVTPEQSDVSLSMGADETQMNFTWYCTTKDAGTLLVAKESDLADGQMPASAAAYETTPVGNNDGKYTNQVTATDLEAGVTYAYQMVNGQLKSEIKTFTTDDGGAFSFAFVADPQIGASGNATNDTAGWDKTLNIIGINDIFSDVSFLLSAGDQVNTASSETEYDGYLDHEAMASLPAATVIGNHDSGSNAYSQHFNAANESAEYGTTTAGGDSWFVYNNVLFMVLNSNDQSEAEHKAFMEAAIAANPDVSWKVVSFHHSIYSVASHATQNDILNRRNTLVPIFKELDIDVVLMGHDHVYCRTYMMSNFAPSEENYTYDNGEDKAPTAVTDPNGILYVTANSGSGSKHYNIQNMEFPYSAVQNQERVPNVSKVSVSDNQFTITTYRTSDMTVVDTFTINRTPQKTLESISVTTQPTKTVYTEGETFDPAGMVVTAAYSDGSSEVVTDYTYGPADQLTPDVTGITVTYEGKTASVPVTVNQAVVTVNTTSDTGLVEYLSSYSTGNTNAEGGVAEIVKFNADNDCMYLVSGQTQTLDIVQVKEDGTTQLVKKIDIAALGSANGFSAGDITSVDVNTDRDLVAIAVQHADYDQNGAIVTLDYDGNFVAKYEAGVQPDMVTFSPNGQYILSANEGEPRNGYGDGAVDPKGSVTVVDLTANAAKTITFDSVDRETALANGVLLKTDTAPSVDLEPEFIAVSSDSKTAYVTLQENNAIAALNIADGTWTYVKGLGFKDHSAQGNGLDLDVDGAVDIRNETVYGVYMPDGISVVTIGGVDYLLTANEGDAREWGDYENIDSDKLILSDGEKAGKKIEFLDTSKTDGLEEGKTYVLGGRSFSIWKASTLEQVFDSGDDFESVTAQEFPDYFNSGHDEAGLDKRSHKKGVEPETISVLETNGKTYAVIGLERMGGIMVYDITDPANPSYADYLNVRGFSETVADLSRLGDLGPEGICTIPASASPTGNAMILVANEVSGTVTVAQIEKTAEDDAGSTGGSGSSSGGTSSKPSVNPVPNPSVPDSAELPFTDVAETDWFYEGVSYVYENGIMTGMTDTTFGPGVTTTRGMVVTMLWRMEDQPEAAADAGFTDVKDGFYYTEAIDWAAENGIVNGITETTFAPDQVVTRQQLAAILYRYSQMKGYDLSAQGDLTVFGDWEQVSPYAVEPMEWAVGSGLIQGMDGNLVPAGGATRTQLATVFQRFITNFGS